MPDQNPQQRLLKDVRHFLEVYKVLSPDGKAQFEAQMAGSIKGQDEKSKKLFHTLLQAAKDGKDVEAAIQEMNKTNG